MAFGITSYEDVFLGSYGLDSWAEQERIVHIELLKLGIYQSQLLHWSFISAKDNYSQPTHSRSWSGLDYYYDVNNEPKVHSVGLYEDNQVYFVTAVGDTTVEVKKYGSMPIDKFKCFIHILSDKAKYTSPEMGAIPNQKQILSGLPDGTLGLDRQITRAEVAAFFVKLMELDTDEFKGKPSSFKDVADDHWAKDAIEAVTKAGLFAGYPGNKFGPSDKLTRIQNVTLLARQIEKMPGTIKKEDLLQIINTNPFYEKGKKQIWWQVDRDEGVGASTKELFKKSRGIQRVRTYANPFWGNWLIQAFDPANAYFKADTLAEYQLNDLLVAFPILQKTRNYSANYVYDLYNEKHKRQPWHKAFKRGPYTNNLSYDIEWDAPLTRAEFFTNWAIMNRRDMVYFKDNTKFSDLPKEMDVKTIESIVYALTCDVSDISTISFNHTDAKIRKKWLKFKADERTWSINYIEKFFIWYDKEYKGKEAYDRMAYIHDYEQKLRKFYKEIKNN